MVKRLEQLPHDAARIPHAPWRERRRLFVEPDAGQPEDRGRLVHDAVLLGLEIRLPQEGLTTPVLLDWAQDPDFGWPHPHRAHHLTWAPLAAACREAVIIEGRGARVTLPPFGADVPEAERLRAIVHLATGAVCRIYRSEARPVDGAEAVLIAPPGGDVVEVRYREDESVLVELANDGGRIVKRPYDGLIFHEEASGVARHARHGPRPPVHGVGGFSGTRPPHRGGATYEADDGTEADAYLRFQGRSALTSTACVKASPKTHGRGQPSAVSDSHLEPERHLAQKGHRHVLSPPPANVATLHTPRLAAPPPSLSLAGRMLTGPGSMASARLTNVSTAVR